MSDIHGLHDKFMKMLEKIQFSDSDILYILGDVIDRGPDGIKSYQYIMQHENIHVLKGNHEDFFLKAFSPGADIGWDENTLKELVINNRLWLVYNGGAATYKAFIQLKEEEQKRIYHYIRQEKEFELIKVSGQQYLLIHAGLNLTEGMSLQEILERDLKQGQHLWIREDFLCSPNRLDSMTIIFGHTPTPLLPVHYLDADAISDSNALRCKMGMIYYGNGKIDIDCGCAGNLNLGCLRLDDFEEFYT